MSVLDRIRRAVCCILGCRWGWLKYGDPVLCPPDVEPWRCRCCKLTVWEKHSDTYGRWGLP